MLFTMSIFSGLEYTFIPSGRGKNSLLMIENYTFNQVKKDPRYWNCSKRTTMGCKAKVHFDIDFNITCYIRDHNHIPPRYFLQRDGSYLKIR